MKIQCSCGAKYAFDVTPETAQTPVRFVCPACGLDSSDFVNRLVRQELGLPEPAAAPGPAPVARPLQSATGPRPGVGTESTDAGSRAGGSGAHRLPMSRNAVSSTRTNS